GSRASSSTRTAAPRWSTRCSRSKSSADDPRARCRAHTANKEASMRQQRLSVLVVLMALIATARTAGADTFTQARVGFCLNGNVPCVSLVGEPTYQQVPVYFEDKSGCRYASA